jgi:methylase of polypeptide subunit release factors
LVEDIKERNQRSASALIMLDTLLSEKKTFEWNQFYSDRTKMVPFFKNVPDENLVEYVERGLFKGSRALDLGCGNGRNAIYQAEEGFEADAIDSSSEALQ